MCAADHAAVAAELWCAMLRNPDYVRGVEGLGEDAHLMDFRANICQLEYHTWLAWPQISQRVRMIKKCTEKLLNATDVSSFKVCQDIYMDLRAIWAEIMELREAEREQDVQ